MDLFRKIEQLLIAPTLGEQGNQDGVLDLTEETLGFPARGTDAIELAVQLAQGITEIVEQFRFSGFEMGQRVAFT